MYHFLHGLWSFITGLGVINIIAILAALSYIVLMFSSDIRKAKNWIRWKKWK